MIIPRLFWQSFVLAALLGSQFTLLADAYDPSASVIRFQKKMAIRGNMESQFKLGLIYETGSGLDIDLPTAINWYKKAAEQNYTPASNRLTYLEVKQYGFRSDHAEWLKTLKKDAKFHDGEALFLLGQMYSEGTGVNKSLTLSLTLLRKAARGNIPGADTAIIRIEKELKQLQAQYMQEQKAKEKKKASLAFIATAKSTTKTQKITRPSITQITPIKSAPKPPQKRTKKQIPKSMPRATYKPSHKIKTIIASAPKKAIAPVIIETPAVDESEHPMDSICGGRNRFSRACR